MTRVLSLLALLAVLDPGAAAQSTSSLPAAIASNPHLKDGLAAYASHDFKKAVPALKAALEELQSQPGFETSLPWRVLVDNLGMAQGISGNLANESSVAGFGMGSPGFMLALSAKACLSSAIAESRLRPSAKTHARL